MARLPSLHALRVFECAARLAGEGMFGGEQRVGAKLVEGHPCDVHGQGKIVGEAQVDGGFAQAPPEGFKCLLAHGDLDGGMALREGSDQAGGEMGCQILEAPQYQFAADC